MQDLGCRSYYKFKIRGVVQVTPRAWLLTIKDIGGNEVDVWLPKSRCVIIGKCIHMPKWIAVDHMLMKDGGYA